MKVQEKPDMFAYLHLGRKRRFAGYRLRQRYTGRRGGKIYPHSA
jgi:hypothetical protein